MAFISSLYVCATTETIDNDVTASNHPTETGLPTTDSIRKQPIVVSLKGKIVDYKMPNATTPADKIISMFKKWQSEGRKVVYVGQVGRITDLLIVNFKEDYNNKNNGGADFEMTLQQTKTAKKAYVATKPVVTKKEGGSSTSNKAKLKVGDKVDFAGGWVYGSSDAKKTKTKRNSSKCVITKISTLKNATHIYHVKSIDGRLVYGWVDANRVRKTTTVATKESNAGTQQVTSPNKKVIYHKVKLGDTLYKLVNNTYRSYNLSITKIVNDNPALKVRPKYTLLIGEKLKLTLN